MNTEAAENSQQCEWGEDIPKPGTTVLHFEQCRNPWTGTITDHQGFMLNVCDRCRIEAEEIGWVEWSDPIKVSP